MAADRDFVAGCSALSGTVLCAGFFDALVPLILVGLILVGLILVGLWESAGLLVVDPDDLVDPDDFVAVVFAGVDFVGVDFEAPSLDFVSLDFEPLDFESLGLESADGLSGDQAHEWRSLVDPWCV